MRLTTSRSYQHAQQQGLRFHSQGGEGAIRFGRIPNKGQNHTIILVEVAALRVGRQYYSGRRQ
jgi:hypothetical protein